MPDRIMKRKERLFRAGAGMIGAGAAFVSDGNAQRVIREKKP